MVVSLAIRRCLAAVVIASFLHFTVAAGHSQIGEPLSEIKTTVFDESGALVPDCKIVFRSDSSTVVSHTDVDGSVTVGLPSGKYVVTTTKAGFVKNTITDAQIRPSIQNEIRIVLKVASTSRDGSHYEQVPTTASDLPVTIKPETYPVTLPRALIRKYRSWRCLYLWKCYPS